MDEIARAYDRAPYPDYAFWHTQPTQLGMYGRLFGLPTADPDRCRVLEIGCAVGGNIVPMAVASPGSHFVGVDLSGVQIARASQTAQAVGANNLTLIHGDFREVPERLGPFDYIICHGVFAWITPETQAALLDFVHQRMTLNGIAFISYNCYPGHHMVDMVRKLLNVHTSHAPDLQAKTEQAQAIMRFMLRMSKRGPNDWRTGFLETELKMLQESGPAMLEHDYCARASHPLYFVDFVAKSRAARLEYLADSTPWKMYLDNQSPEIVETLKPLEDLVLQGQYLDFISNSRFRESLVCQGAAPLSREVVAATVRDFHIGHALASEPTLDGIATSLPVTVEVTNRPPMTLANPIIRLALRRLYQAGRYAQSFDELAQATHADLIELGLTEHDLTTVRERLAGQLLRVFFAGGVWFTLRPAPVARSLPERPATGLYQRHQAREDRPGVTALTHEVFGMTPMMRALLPNLDGTRTHQELQALWPDEPIEQSLGLLLKRGYIIEPGP